MTPTDLVSWRRELGISRAEASRRLGVSERMLAYYEAGKREDGRAVEIPRTVALACSALYHRLPPFGE